MPAPHDVRRDRRSHADPVGVDRRQEPGVGPPLVLVQVLHVLLDELLGPAVGGRVVPVEPDDDRVRTAELGQAGHPLVGLIALRERADERPADLVEGELLDEVGRVVLLVDVDEGHRPHHVRRTQRVVEDHHLVLVAVALAAVDAVTLVLHHARVVADLARALVLVVVDHAVETRDVQPRIGLRVRVLRVAPAEQQRDQVEVDVGPLHLQRVPAGTDHATRLLVEVTERQSAALLDRRAELFEVRLRQPQSHHFLLTSSPVTGVSGGPLPPESLSII